MPDSNFGWSARDACYSFGSYDLAEDEALVVTHRPPTVPVLEHRASGTSSWPPTAPETAARSVNIGSAVPNADGTVTIVIAMARRPTPTR